MAPAGVAARPAPARFGSSPGGDTWGGGVGGLRGQRRGRIAVPQAILAALQSALRGGGGLRGPLNL